MIGSGAFDDDVLEVLSDPLRRDLGMLFQAGQTRFDDFQNGTGVDVPDREADAQAPPATAIQGTAGEDLPPPWASLDEDESGAGEIDSQPTDVGLEEGV